MAEAARGHGGSGVEASRGELREERGAAKA